MSDSRKSRRSSILKPPKPRNPLSDVDLNPPNIDATFMKSRRVSFANSNFIKEFTADPEKNTIWHNSYEEEVNKSEDSKNGEQQQDNLNISKYEEQDDFNCTKINIFDNSMETPLLNSPLETSICSTNEELTAPTNNAISALNFNPSDEIIIQRAGSLFLPVQYDVAFNCDNLSQINQNMKPTENITTIQNDNVNIPLINRNFQQLLTNHRTNMEITGSIPANSILMKNIIKSKQQLGNSSISTNLYGVKVPATLNLNNKENQPYCIVNSQEYQVQIDNKQDEMELTLTGIDIKNIKSNSTLNSSDLNLTETIPAAIVENENYIQFNNCITEICTMGRNDMEFTQAIPSGIKLVDECRSIEDNMELTLAVPAGIKFISNENKANNCTMGRNDMEFTQAISSSINLLNNCSNIECNNMELTSSLTPGNKLISNENKENNYTMERNDMEFTQAIPSGIKLIDEYRSIEDNMELTSAVPAGIKFVNNKNKENNCTVERNDMKFTQAISSSINLLNNCSNIECNNMELTSSLTPGNKLIINENKENNYTMGRNDMEFTQAIPSGIKLIDEYRSIEDNMELTSAVPAGIKFVNNKNKENNCTVERNDMKFTQAISSSINLLNNCSNIECNNMELTSSLTPGNKLIINENKENNYTMGRNNMEFTQAIPSGIKLIDECRSIEDNMELTSAVPAGIKFINNKNKENKFTVERNDMEFTQAISSSINLLNNCSNIERNNMELPASLTAGNKLISNENKENNYTMGRNDMEFTQAIPSGIKLIEECRSIEDNMELTSAGSAGIKFVNNKNKENNYTMGRNDMEFTQAIPSGIKLIDECRSIEDNMELTSAVPAGIKFIINKNKENNCTVERNDMEFTQALASGIKLVDQCRSIEDNNMELTAAVPSGTKFINNEKKENNCTMEINCMELTEALPSAINLNCCNIELAATVPAGIKLINHENKENKCTRNINYLETTQTILSDVQLDNNCSTVLENITELAVVASAGKTLINNESIENNSATEKNNMEFTQEPSDMELINNCRSIKENNMELNKEITFCSNDNVETNYSSEKKDVKYSRTELNDEELIINSKKLEDNENIAEEITHDLLADKNEDYTEKSFKINKEKSRINTVSQINIEEISNINVNDLHNSLTIDEIQENFDNIKKATNADDNIISQCLDATSNELIEKNIKLNQSRNIEMPIENTDLNSDSLENPQKLSNTMEISKTISSNNLINTEEFHESVQNNEIIPSCSITDVDTIEDADKLIEQKSKSEDNYQNVFHLKGYPLILSPDPDILTSTDSNKSDICLRIKYLPHGEIDESLSLSQMELKMHTPNASYSNSIKHESFSINKSSFIDSTEKLINYQIGYTPALDHSDSFINSNNKRRSSVNICDTPHKHMNIEHKTDEMNQLFPTPSCEFNVPSNSKQDENILWNCMVEKSFISKDVLSSENVSLVNSFDSDDDDPMNKETLPMISASDFLNKIIQNLKSGSDSSGNDIPDIRLEVASNDQLKDETYRKRFEESFKKQKCQINELKALTLNEKIIQKSKDAIWNIVELNEFVYTFNFMFETIEFVVHVAEKSENVKKVEFFSQFCELTSHPSAIYVHRILKKKLTQNFFTSALGEPYNVLSLLDLITITGEQMLDVLNEFDALECRYGLVLNTDLKAKIKYFDSHLPTAFEVIININNSIENITKDDISVNTLVGEVDENAIKKLINGCPQGIQLFRSFLFNIQGYIKFLKCIKNKKH